MGVQYKHIVEAYQDANAEWARKGEEVLRFAAGFMGEMQTQLHLPDNRLAFLLAQGREVAPSLRDAIWFEDGWWRWQTVLTFGDTGIDLDVRIPLALKEDSQGWVLSTEDQPDDEQWNLNPGSADDRKAIFVVIAEQLLERAREAGNPASAMGRGGRARIGFNAR